MSETAGQAYADVAEAFNRAADIVATIKVRRDRGGLVENALKVVKAMLRHEAIEAEKSATKPNLPPCPFCGSFAHLVCNGLTAEQATGPENTSRSGAIAA